VPVSGGYFETPQAPTLPAGHVPLLQSTISRNQLLPVRHALPLESRGANAYLSEEPLVVPVENVGWRGTTCPLY